VRSRLPLRRCRPPALDLDALDHLGDHAAERDGKAQPLAELWPGGYQPGDRLGVVVAQPMDPVGCSNLICATITLFYDYLRSTLGTGNFFRYCDTYLFGVGCEAFRGGTLPVAGEVCYAGVGSCDRCAALAADRVVATDGFDGYLEERRLDLVRGDGLSLEPELKTVQQ